MFRHFGKVGMFPKVEMLWKENQFQLDPWKLGTTIFPWAYGTGGRQTMNTKNGNSAWRFQKKRMTMSFTLPMGTIFF